MRSNCSMWAPTVLVLLLVALLASGCAGSVGSAKPLIEAPGPEALARYTKVAFKTSAEGNASKMTASDQERIVALVTQKVKELAPNRFTESASTVTDADTLHVTIAFTRYDEGNAFARAMLAGLGQIRIDAEVTLEDRALQKVLDRSEVTKTFAWGGVYGATTGIKDIEAGFAEAVAKVLLGQSL